MTKYLNTKPGSVEEVVANMNKNLKQDGAYQDMFCLLYTSDAADEE